MGICSCGRVCWHVQQCWCCSDAPQTMASRCLKPPALHSAHWLLSKPAGVTFCLYPSSNCSAAGQCGSSWSAGTQTSHFLNLSASELALQRLCKRQLVEKLETQHGIDKRTLRMRECSKGSWPSGQGDPQEKAHSWPSQTPNLASQHLDFLGCFLSLPHKCPHNNTPVNFQELCFVWPVLGLNSWLSQWPLPGTSHHFGVSEMLSWVLFYFPDGLAASLPRWQTCKNPLFRCSTPPDAFGERYGKMVHPTLR